MSNIRSGRPRGAQPRNTNHLRHGLYSTRISVTDDRELESMPRDQSDHELALARVRLKHLILMQERAARQEWLGYEKAIQHYIDRIASITHNNALLGGDRRASFVTVLEMIRQVNDEQKVS